MPRQNLLPATSYFRSRICTGTMLRSGCFFRRVVCEPSDGEMVTTLSVSVLAENSSHRRRGAHAGNPDERPAAQSAERCRPPPAHR